MKKIINTIIAIIILTAITFFSHKSYSSAKKLEKINTSYYKAQTDIGKLIKRRFSSILSTLSMGMLESKNSNKVNLNELKAKKIVLKEKNKKYTIYLAISATILLLSYFILDITTFSFTVALASLITLLYGIITPILMIVIHKNVNYLGDIVLSFESKTIIGTIEHLYNNANYPIAIVILLFSVIVPLLKTISMIAVLIWKEFHIAKKLVTLFKHLGKWSMLDVFVVSLLLVYLSAGSSENSYSEIESGLYIFLIYVILSIITSIGVNKVLSFKNISEA